MLIWNIWVSLRRGQPAGDNPWEAWTLEWATTSPPPAHNFAVVPPVRSARPLWDLAHPERRRRAARPRPDARGRAAGPACCSGPRSPSSGMLTFISSEAFFFGSLIVSYMVYRGRSPEGPGPHDLDVLQTALFSLALFASSATIVLAERRLHDGDQRGFRALAAGDDRARRWSSSAARPPST